MSDSIEDRPIPKAAIISACVLIAFTIVVAATSKQTGLGKTQVQFATVVQERDLFFEDKAEGAVDVIDAADGSIIKTYYAGEGAFIRGVMRGLVRERRSHGAGPEVPFRLEKHADGRYSINDPVTKRRIDLKPFGETNYMAFAALLDANATDMVSDQKLSMRE